MEISKGAASLAAAVCLVAGAGAAYLVTRPASVSDLPVASAQEPSVSPDPAAPPVEQSEAVVTEQPQSAPAERDAADESTAAPVRRRTTSSNGASPRAAANRGSERAEATRTGSGEIDDNYVAPPPSVEPRVATPPTLAPSLPEPEPVEPAAQFEDLVVAADSVIGLEVESAITSERAQVEDEVTARVTRDVKVGDRVAIPAGAQAIGEVTLVERGGKMKERARLGVRFTSIVLADGTRIPIETDTIIREGSSPGNESAAKIGGGAIGGAIIGAILGGTKGAIIGGSAGAGAGTAAVLAGGRNSATLTAGSPVTVRLLKPATVTVEK
jgi:type IV secretory pathway VirB10-like protein